MVSEQRDDGCGGAHGEHGGPDLARATVEPRRVLTFVSGGLERLFITDPSQVEERLRAEPDGRDRLGRFRVQERLCFDDT